MLGSLLVLQPPMGGAQATASETERAQAAVQRDAEAVAVLQAHVAALPNPPSALAPRMLELAATLSAEQRALAAGDLIQVHDAHRKLARRLSRLGRRLRQHLAGTPPAARLRAQFDRIQARANRLRDWAQANGVQVDPAPVIAARKAVASAFRARNAPQVRAALKVYAAAVEQAQEGMGL